MNKDALKDWMKEKDLDREALAKQLGVAEGTLNNWFSKGFPDWGTKAIQRLMTPPAAPAGKELEVTFTASQFDRIERARALTGYKDRKTFYEAAITEFTDEILAHERAKGEQPPPPEDAPPPPAPDSPPPGGGGRWGITRVIGDTFPTEGQRTHGLNEEPPPPADSAASLAANKARLLAADAKRRKD